MEALKQAAIRAIVTAILAAIPIIIAFVVSPDGAEALGTYAWAIPIITALLSGLAKAIGGTTVQMVDSDGDAIRGGPVDGRAARLKTPNILAL